MRKIALFKTEMTCDADYYDISYELDGISSWEEVSEDEFKSLLQYLGSYNKNQSYGRGFRVIVVERVENEKGFVDFSVKAHLDEMRKQEERNKALKVKREEDKKKRDAKKKIKLLAELAKLENNCIDIKEKN